MVNERNVIMMNVLKFFVGAVLALVCGDLLAGCTDVDFTWEDVRSGASVVGFVDDSLVMVGDYRCWSEITDKWNGEYINIDGCGHERLCVYNYRVQEDGPRWCDSLSSEEMTGIFGGQMTDSVIWGGEVSKSVLLWKIGEKLHEIKLSVSTDDCLTKFRISSLKQWLDGTFIGRSGESLDAGGDSCQFAVLDTSKRMLTYKRLDENLKWLEKCDDVRAWGEDVYCLAINEEKNGFGLFFNDEKKDIVFVDSVTNISSLWLSFEFEFMGDMIYFGHNINSINYEQKKIEIYPNVKATSALNFVDESDNNVNYDFK